MMGRLTCFKDGTNMLNACGYLKCKEVCNNHKNCSDCPIQDAFNKLAAYENAAEQGLLIQKTDADITPIIKGKLLVLKSNEMCSQSKMNEIRDFVMRQIAEGVLIVPNGFSYEYLNLQ